MRGPTGQDCAGHKRKRRPVPDRRDISVFDWVDQVPVRVVFGAMLIGLEVLPETG